MIPSRVRFSPSTPENLVSLLLPTLPLCGFSFSLSSTSTDRPALLQTSLFLTSLPPTATEDHIRSYYLSTAGIPSTSLKSVVLVPTSRVAVVNFSDRKSAELAAERSSVKVVIDGAEVKVQWGRSRPKKVTPATGPISMVVASELA
jgi:hypothetical protein